jgi:hypothetical protein
MTKYVLFMLGCQDVRENLRQSHLGIRVLKEGFTGVVILIPNMYNKRWLLVDKHIEQASQNRRSVVDALVRGLAEEVRQQVHLGHRSLQFFDNATEEHRFSLPRITLDP